MIIERGSNMKKSIKFSSAALLTGILLTGCSNNQSTKTSSQSSEKSAVKSNTLKKSPEKNTSSQKENNSTSSTESSSSSSESSESSKTSSNASSKSSDRMTALTGQLRKNLNGMLLPTSDGLGTGSKNLNVRYTSTANKNTVYYSVGNSPASFNASSVKSEKPYAVLTEYKDVSDPTSLINYQSPQKGLPTVDLGSGVTGTIEGAAGSQYLQFNQDKWSFVVQASSVKNQKPNSTAKNLLKLYKKYGLPNTASNASVHVKVGESFGSLNTTIIWQSGSSVYKMQAHSTKTAFIMLNSLK